MNDGFIYAENGLPVAVKEVSPDGSTSWRLVEASNITQEAQELQDYAVRFRVVNGVTQFETEQPEQGNVTIIGSLSPHNNSTLWKKSPDVVVNGVDALVIDYGSITIVAEVVAE